MVKLYENIDTGVIWSEQEIVDGYICNEDLWEKYPTFDEYMENLLNLGKQRIGGLIEVEHEIIDMVAELLNISYDIYEWDDIFFESTVCDVVREVMVLKNASDSINLFELLLEAYKCGYFESTI